MNQNLHMTRTERVQRIGAILSKGVSLLLLREAESKRKVDSVPAVTLAERGFDCDESETDVLKYISLVGSASPRDVQRGLSIPKTTAFRRLDRLVKAGCIVRTGKTAAIRYQLAAQQPMASP